MINFLHTRRIYALVILIALAMSIDITSAAPATQSNPTIESKNPIATSSSSAIDSTSTIEVPDTPAIISNLNRVTHPSDGPIPNADQPVFIPPPPAVSAQAYLLIDANNGTVLAQKNANQRMEPASLTKMMSLYVISNALKSGHVHMEDNVKISEHAWRTGGSRMFLNVNTLVSVKDLVQGIIVDSGNDACVAMAEYVGGNETAFTDLMNQTAANLGMRNTHYTDSTGLPNPELYTTAQDLGILARALIKHFPDYYTWYSQKTFTYNKITQPNRNRLLWRDPSVDGIKTGHTDSAGYCLVASAERKGMRLIAIVLKSVNDSIRSNDSEALLNYGYRFFESHKLYSANTVLSKLRVWFGKNPYAPIGLNHDLFITVPTGQYKNLKAQLVLDNAELKAPLKKGQNYGKLQISLNGKEISTVPLSVLEDISKGSIVTRAVDHIAYMFHRH